MTSTDHHITGIILAGGKSSRMGSDKGLLIHKGRTFVEHCIEALSPVTNTIIVVANHSRYKEYTTDYIEDIYKDFGPLGGIYTGLYYSETDHNLILSCDMPLIKSDQYELLIRKYVDELDVLVYENEEQLVPTVGLYTKSCLGIFKSCLENEQLGLINAIKKTRYKSMPISKSERSHFNNINTKTDYAKLVS